MLKGIDPIISPELLKILCEMGHGDEIVIADSNFPSETMGKRVLRADGLGGLQLLKAILKLIPLDSYVTDNAIVMDTNNGTIPEIWDKYTRELKKDLYFKNITKISREDFYERSKKAYCVIASGETAVYANIILKKGVIIYK